MATVPYQVQNVTAEQSDGNILISWQGAVGATSYYIQRSTDGVNFTALAAVGLVTQYVDVRPGIGIAYYYQVAGASAFGNAAQATLTFTGQPAVGNTITVGNITLTAGTDFAIGGTLAATAANLAAALLGALAGIASATSSGNIVTLTASVLGPIGNGLELASALANVTAVPFSLGAAMAGPYSTSAMMVAALPSEMSLYELRLRAQQTADRVNSDFVSTPEWNSFLRLAMYELYDLLITSYEDLFSSDYVYINTNSVTFNYPLPDGVTNYLGGTYGNASGVPAHALYKLVGVDLAVNTNPISPAWVTINKFNFIDRNNYVYPNSTSTIYGVYNMRYRMMGNNINFIPTPAGGQTIRLWYAPKLPSLLQDIDLTTIGYSGWLRYAIVRAAKYALEKEEGSDTSKLDAEILYLKTRIEQTAQNRDIGIPDKISATRRDPIFGGWDNNSGGAQGGF